MQQNNDNERVNLVFYCDVSLSERILPETFNVERYKHKKKEKLRNKQKEKGKIKMSMEIKKQIVILMN